VFLAITVVIMYIPICWDVVAYIIIYVYKFSEVNIYSVFKIVDVRLASNRQLLVLAVCCLPSSILHTENGVNRVPQWISDFLETTQRNIP
jgi:hypothetical protein